MIKGMKFSLFKCGDVKSGNYSHSKNPDPAVNSYGKKLTTVNCQINVPNKRGVFKFSDS